MKSILAKIFQVKPKEHLFYFTPATLKKLLERAGFRVKIMLETGRRRDLGAMDQGATFENKKWLVLSKFLRWTGVDSIAAILMDMIFKEELFAIAEKI